MKSRNDNIIQFPERNQRSPERAVLKERRKDASAGLLQNRSFLAVLIIGFSLFVFNLRTNSLNSSDMASLSYGGRGLASVPEAANNDLKGQFDLARKLASVEITDEAKGLSVGRGPSSDDQVRHGVLSSRGYVFKRNIEDGNLIFIQLQGDENNPAYLLDPSSFLEKYGEWMNSEFSHVVHQGESIVEDRRISRYAIGTKSGKTFEVIIERDLFQRLTSISQTEVSQNTFN